MNRKRSEHIEIIMPDHTKVDRKVSDVIGYLGRKNLPERTMVIHHRESGGKTHFVRMAKGWAVDRVTYA